MVAAQLDEHLSIYQSLNKQLKMPGKVLFATAVFETLAHCFHLAVPCHVTLDLGIQCLVSIPVGASDEDIGESDLAINFAGVTFLPEDHIYADNTGIILSPEPLDIE